MKAQRWQDWVMLVFGVWVFVAPFWMPAYASTSDAAAWSSYILGILLIISPFVLRFYGSETGAAWNQIILGILVGADAIWMLSAYRATERAGA